MLARSGSPFQSKPPPPSISWRSLAALSVDYQQVATFEHGTELLWSNSYKMPNKTYGQLLPESRSLYNTMDHCYGMGDVMTVLRSVVLLFIFFKEKKYYYCICMYHWWCHVFYSFTLYTNPWLLRRSDKNYDSFKFADFLFTSVFLKTFE